MNLLQGKVARANGAAAIVLERTDGAPIVLPAPRERRRRASSPTARKVIFGIRPEAVNDLESADRNSRSRSRRSTRSVEIVEPAGSDTFVVTKIAGKEVTARMRADADVRVGQTPRLRLQPRQGGAVRPGDDATALNIERARRLRQGARR